MQALIRDFALNWAKKQGAKKLRAFAADPRPDLTASWRVTSKRYDVWVKLASTPGPQGARRLATVTVAGESFTLWFKTSNMVNHTLPSPANPR